MAETLTVNLGERTYTIAFGTDLTAEIDSLVEGLKAAGRKAAIVTDANVARDQAARLTAMFGDVPRLVVEPGEAAKSLEGFGKAVDFLAARKIDRGGVL